MNIHQPPPMPARQLRLEDESHLHLLSVFHFVMGGLYVLGLGFIGLHFLFMRMIMAMPQSTPTTPGSTSVALPTSPPPVTPADMMPIMIGFYLVIGIVIAALAIGNILAGIWLRKRIQHTLTFVVAAINCAFFPFGTVLGVFTIIVLSRATVKMTYAANTRI